MIPESTRSLPARLVPDMPPALVISLDFELHWGVCDRTQLDGEEKSRLLAARAAVPLILGLFEELSIHATWAVVGALFAASRDEFDQFRSPVEPGYPDRRPNPCAQRLGRDESEDPFHFAPGLIRLIADCQGQEIASHSFSHYCSLEPGHCAREFDSDLRQAIAIAADSGYRLSSYVFPRNEVNRSYLPLLARHGFKTYRDTERTGMKRPGSFAAQRKWRKRAARFADGYINLFGDETAPWPAATPPAAIPASRYLRPWRPWARSLQPFALDRIREQMRQACEQARIFHLWLHPEDFAAFRHENLRVLRSVLESFARFKESHGMISMTMHEVYEHVRSLAEVPAMAASGTDSRMSGRLRPTRAGTL